MNLDKTARRWDAKKLHMKGEKCKNGDFTAILICNYALRKSERNSLSRFFYLSFIISIQDSGSTLKCNRETKKTEL